MEIIYFLVFIFALKCALKVMLHPIRTVKAFKELLLEKKQKASNKLLNHSEEERE